LARLIQQLLNEKKLDKAEEIADIAMENMPVEHFGFYTLLEPYIGAYYEVGSKEKARTLFKKVAQKYQENLKYYGSLKTRNQERLFEDIYTDISRYKALVDVLSRYDKEFAKEEGNIFNNYLRSFSHFYGGEEPEVEPIERDLPLDTSLPIEMDSVN